MTEAFNRVIRAVKCLRCLEKWFPRVPHPKRCPYCGSYDWDKKPEGK